MMQNPHFTMQKIPAVNRLPVETLTEIFRLYYASQKSLFDVTLLGISGQLRTEMHIMTSICQLWRDIILSIPEFWTSFSLDLGEIWSVERAKYIIETFSRSENYKLRLHIIFNSSSLSPSTLDTLTQSRVQFTVLAHIWSLANKWRDVKLNLNLDQQLYHGVISTLSLGIHHKPLGGHFPNLERLECQIDRDDKDGDLRRDLNSPDRVLLRVFNPCPALCHLSVYDALDVASCGHPQSLTTLELLRFEGSSLATLLARLPNLRHFCLYQNYLTRNNQHVHENSGPWSESNPFYHTGITSLSLPIYETSLDIYPPWADVRFPSLHTIDIDEVEDVFDAESIWPILDLLTKSEYKLQTLILGKVSWEMFEDLLLVTPSLRNVILRTAHVGMVLLETPEQFLAPLCGTESEVPLPDLSCLQVEIDAEILAWHRWNNSDAHMEDDDGNAMVDDMGDPRGSANTEFEDDPEDDTIGNITSGGPQNPSARMEEDEARFIELIVARFRHLISSRPNRGPPSVRFVTEPAIGPLPSNPNVDPIAQLPEYLLAVTNMDEETFGTVTVELHWD
ncbi:hypothetical protein F5878DRAFT_612075 [Lentinula raphanica]|uniref:F-box domain-containing protein n=1 Tax=Lentinula raphanica TaxID=153919 RepID=A0AA38PDA3_9AGAR|nr:hypothetical protein F5880DRAFT_483104 [Lentinula raphanica]KAJ3840803.1 hypothetical protein F5878DRAFT_612075 [Lentinula raphanica]